MKILVGLLFFVLLFVGGDNGPYIVTKDRYLFRATTPNGKEVLFYVTTYPDRPPVIFYDQGGLFTNPCTGVSVFGMPVRQFPEDVVIEQISVEQVQVTVN